MAIFNWEAEYSVGHEKIDRQHRQIVDILNHLYALLNSPEAGQKDNAEAVFDQLASYVTNHFAYEEELLFRSGYPAELLIEHRTMHSELLVKVQSIVSAYREGDEAALAELLPFLYGNWLIEHICGTDKSYAAYVGADKDAGQVNQKPTPA